MGAEMTAANSTAPLSFQDRAAAEETLHALSAETHIIEAGIYDRAGRAFASYSRSGAKSPFAVRLRQPGQYFEKDAVSVFRPVILDHEAIGSIYLRSDLEKAHSRLRRYSAILIVVMFASCLVAFLFSCRLQAIISKPILHLSETARRVSRHDRRFDRS